MQAKTIEFEKERVNNYSISFLNMGSPDKFQPLSHIVTKPVEESNMPTQNGMIQDILSLDDLEVSGSVVNGNFEGRELMTDYSGRVFYWEVLPGQENLPPEETQEVIAVYPYE